MTKPRPHNRAEASSRARAAFGTIESAGIAPDGNPYPAWIYEDEVPVTFAPCVCEVEWEIAPAFYLARHDLIQCFLCAGRVMCPTGRHGAMFCRGPGSDLAYTDLQVETFLLGLMDAEYPVAVFPRGLYLGCPTCCRQSEEGCGWNDVLWEGTA